MAANSGRSATTHFGRQMKKERLARGWSLREFAARSGVDIGSASLIENGKRPPNERVATACDDVFPERGGWFREYYEESKDWMPAGFRDWGEYENTATTLRVWAPGIIHGLLQTAGYARAMIAIEPAITEEIAHVRLANRMERQRRVLMRDDPPTAWFIIDEFALHRRVGSAEAMADQMEHLLAVAAMPRTTVTVMPAVEHPANASEFIIVDDGRAAYAEHMISGYTYTDDLPVSSLAVRFDSLRGECYRVSESMALIREMRDAWRTGGNPLTRAATGGPA